MTLASIAYLLASELLVLSLCSALVFVPVWIVCVLLRDRMPHLRALLWALVLVRMLVPPAVSTVWSLPGWLTEVRAPHTISVPQIGSSSPTMPPQQSVRQGGLPSGAAQALVICWFAGFTFTLGRWNRNRSRRLKLISRSSFEPDATTASLAEMWRARLAISRPVRVLLSPEASAPFTVGVIRPVVFLPLDYERMASEQLSVVVGHELSHVRRIDDLWIRLEAVARSLFFFHPAAWIATARLREVREQLADELTVRHSEMRGRDYARVLIDTVALQRGARFASAFGESSRSSLERRILRLTTYDRARRPLPAVLVGLLAAAGLLSMGLSPSRATPGSVVEASSIRHPLPGARVSSPFGPRTDPFSGNRSVHRGIDLTAGNGPDVLAVAAGTVVVATERYAPAPDQGAVVVIRHAEGLTTFNSHLGAIRVHDGERVEAGQPIGEVGSTGKVTGPHLHFEMWRGDEPLDPAPFLEDAGEER